MAQGLSEITLAHTEHNEGFKDIPLWQLEKEHPSFIDIDRKEENKDVVKFQKSGDPDILEKLYRQRIPTLQIWAHKYRYLSYSADDMFGEFTFHFMKSIQSYEEKRGDFNTLLYSSLLYCARNMRSNKQAKKRRPLEDNDPNKLSNFVVSLDQTKSDDDVPLRELIANENATEEDVASNMCLKEAISVLSKEDSQDRELIGFLKRISDGNSVAYLLREYKTRSGKLRLTPQQANKFSKRMYKRLVAEMIQQRKNIREPFTLVGYEVNKQTLSYVIELKKEKRADKAMRLVRKLRRNKAHLVQKIMG